MAWVVGVAGVEGFGAGGAGVGGGGDGDEGVGVGGEEFLDKGLDGEEFADADAVEEQDAGIFRAVGKDVVAETEAGRPAGAVFSRAEAFDN